MIGKVTYGSRFGSLRSYLIKEDGGKGLINYLAGDSERVGDVDYWNTMTRDPNSVVKEMDWVAGQNNRVRKPVMHFSLSFHSKDQVTQEKMKALMCRTLSGLGLEDHQAMTVIHIDKEHPHIHAMVNRVHPRTYKAWDRSHEYARIETILRGLEKEHGLTRVRSSKELEYRSPSISELSQAKRIDQYVQAMNMKLFGRKTEEVVSIIENARSLYPELKRAQSFGQLDKILGQKGLYIDQAGPGAKITDGLRSVKASRIHRGFSIKSLEQKFGVRLKDYIKERDASVSKIESWDMISKWQEVKGLAGRDQKINALEKELHNTQELIHAASRWQKLYAGQVDVIRKSIKKLFDDTLPAFERLQEHVGREGFDHAMNDLRSDPERFGVVTYAYSASKWDEDDFRSVFDAIENGFENLKDIRFQYPKFYHCTMTEVQQIQQKAEEKESALRQQIALLIEKNPGHSLQEKKVLQGIIRKNLFGSDLRQQLSEAGKDMDRAALVSISLAKNISKVVANPSAIPAMALKKAAMKSLQQMTLSESRGAGRGR